MLEKGKIGIFWIFENKIFYKTQEINEIESINGFKDSDLSHYKAWDEIRGQHSKFYLYEYEDIPRGRVVFNEYENSYVVYANKKLLSKENNKNIILHAFNLSQSLVEFKVDEHYTLFTEV